MSRSLWWTMICWRRLETIELELRIDSTKSPNLEDVLDVSGASTSFMLADADSGQVSITTSGTPSFREDQRVEVTVELPAADSRPEPT